MNEAEITRYITDTFEGVDITEAMNASFFFYNPPGELPPDHRLPFVTLVTTDEHDQASDLNRPGVFRLNIGVDKETYQAMFGPQPAFSKTGEVANTGHDFTALDQIMPHPIYAAMSWVCVLNPSEVTFQSKVQPLLAEAYAMAVDRHARREATS